MLEYWMANNDSLTNNSDLEIQEVIEDPGSAILFSGYPQWLLYFAAVCCVLFMLIGIPGNLITVIALFRTKKLRNATAVFIMNLSISDLMFCCFNLPLATSTFWYSTWMHGPLLCRLFPLLRYGLVAVSLFTVLAITINRYVMIGHPKLYPKLYKPKYLLLMVVATWISGFGALVMTWLEQWGRFGLDPGIGSCSILPDINGHSPKEFLFILAFLTPCIAIVVCYARIFYIVRKTALKSRRREKVTTDLVKATLEVKYTKSGDDSALGSSFGATATTTENGGSPIKNDKIQCQQINLPYLFVSNSNEDFDKTLNNSKINFNDEKRVINTSRMDNISERNEESSNLDIACNVQVVAIDCDDINIQDKNFHQHRNINKVENENSNTEHLSPVVTSNFRLSQVDSTRKKSMKVEIKEQILNSSTLRNKEKCLQVPRGFFQNLDNCSQHMLTLPSLQCDVSEVSEEFVSSRSDSPVDKRTKKNRIFRRESRFRSIKNRGIESGKMTAKDKKLLKMILVIFSSFLICYLPITVTKIFKDMIDWRGLNIVGYILIYLTTCINPIIYVVMSSEYRSAYKNILLCRSDSSTSKCKSRVK